MHPVKQNDDVLPQLSGIVVGLLPEEPAQILAQEGKRVSLAASLWQENLALSNQILEGEVALDRDRDQYRYSIPGLGFRRSCTFFSVNCRCSPASYRKIKTSSFRFPTGSGIEMHIAGTHPAAAG